MDLCMGVNELFRKYDYKKGLTEVQCKEIIKKLGVPVPTRVFARDAGEAEEAGEKTGYPVVMKIVSRDILHKSDAGCVQLNLNNKEEVKEAYDKILKNAVSYNKNVVIEGVMVEKMAEKGTEMIVGFKRDSTFGPIVLAGLGGIFVEIFKDASLRVLPVSEEEAGEMISELKGFPLLNGARGRPLADIDAVKDIIIRASCIIQEVPEVEEIDFNPVIVYEKGKGAVVVDARIITRGGEAGE